MNTLATGISYFDLNFQGLPHVIAGAVLHGTRGVALVDPGPTSTLPALIAELDQSGMRLGDVTDILLTHIHLDHAGATGTIVARNPAARVWVHEVGVPHLVAPGKLLASAGRLYGDQMDQLWGEVRPVPAASIVPLDGGERLDIAGRTWDVAYTPGHASHHVSYFDADSGVAFVGDTAGIRMPGSVVIPPTPPPDIDLERWRDSLAAIALRPLVADDGAPCRDACAHGPGGGAGEALARTGRRGCRPRGVVQRRAAPRTAAPCGRRRAGLRARRPLRSELARAGEVLEEKELMKFGMWN
jgi:glyoxylase-like metal-dependent hydrolase (beta-lactamase superfamily II)